MLRTASDRHMLRKTAGAIGAVALAALGSAPAAAADDPQPGLALSPVSVTDGIKPGSSFEVPLAFTNKGSAALDKVWLSYNVTRGLAHTELPSNCLRYEIHSYDEAPSYSDAVCEFDQTVEPGVVYAPEKTLTLKAQDWVLYDKLRVAVTSYNSGGDDGAEAPVRGTGPAVKLVEQPGATPGAGNADHPDWDAADVEITADNTADFQVTGGKLTGRVGDTVSLNAKFTNAGPGWVLKPGGHSVSKVLIDMPAGTTVTKASGYCTKVGSGSYECGTSQSWLNEGQVTPYDFTLKINKVVSGAKGSVALDTESRPFDENKANDTADITLDVTGDGSTSGTGSTGGGGSTSSTGGSGTTSTGGSGTTGGSTTGGSSTTGTSGTSGTSTSSTGGGDLASTGSGSTLPLAGAAAAALVAGTGAVVLVRRRAARR
ncbi:hypothetical protein [Streptomyces sp. R35]|uniref:Gram-positive cocci surface proteins LPxTG domain-containing protein n=1 Tax=Streptomyces sp. R35 TaxID=3238630 RepID=A0AB39SA85_9ACTN